MKFSIISGFLVISSLPFLSACSTHQERVANRSAKMKMEQLDKLLASAGYSEVANSYDSKYGSRTFRNSVERQGFDAYQNEGVDLNVVDAFNRTVFLDPGATEVAIPEYKKFCVEGKQGPCEALDVLNKLQKNRKECSEEKGKACLNVALLYQKNNFSLQAAKIAQLACVYKEQSGCTLYDQITAEQKDKVSRRAAQDADQQQKAMYLMELQRQNNQQLVNSLQGLSNNTNAQPPVQKNLNCTSRERPNSTGHAIVDTECQ